MTFRLCKKANPDRTSVVKSCTVHITMYSPETGGMILRERECRDNILKQDTYSETVRDTIHSPKRHKYESNSQWIRLARIPNKCSSSRVSCTTPNTAQYSCDAVPIQFGSHSPTSPQYKWMDIKITHELRQKHPLSGRGRYGGIVPVGSSPWSGYFGATASFEPVSPRTSVPVDDRWPTRRGQRNRILITRLESTFRFLPLSAHWMHPLCTG